MFCLSRIIEINANSLLLSNDYTYNYTSGQLDQIEAELPCSFYEVQRHGSIYFSSALRRDIRVGCTHNDNMYDFGLQIFRYYSVNRDESMRHFRWDVGEICWGYRKLVTL